MVVPQAQRRRRAVGRLAVIGVVLYVLARLHCSNEHSPGHHPDLALVALTLEDVVPEPKPASKTLKEGLETLAAAVKGHAKCSETFAKLDPEGAVCGLDLEDRCPSECSKSIDYMAKCVGKEMFNDTLERLGISHDTKHYVHISKELVGVNKFDLTMYMPLLARSFSLHSTALWRCTFNTTKTVARFLPKARGAQSDCDLAMEVFRQSRASLCDPYANMGSCNFQCEALISEVAGRCRRPGAFHDRAGKLQYINDTSVQGYLTAIVPPRCEQNLRRWVFHEKEPESVRPYSAVDGHFAPIASAGYLALLLLVGKTLRVKIALLRALSLPASLIGGFVGMGILMGLHSFSSGIDDWIKQYWMLGWGHLPGFLINVIFSTVFIGVDVPSVTQVWEEAGPHLVYGHVIAMGQYSIGLGTGMLLNYIGFAVPPFFGIILPAGFSGGHGTAAAFKDGYNFLGWDTGYDATLMSATIGLVGGMISGILLINTMKMAGQLPKDEGNSQGGDGQKSSDDEWQQLGLIPPSRRKPGALLTTSGEAMESMTLQASFALIATFSAYGLKRTLILVEGRSEVLSNLKLFSSLPMFPLCMIAGLVVSSVLKGFGCAELIDRKSLDRVNGLSLDILLLCAIATMDLSGVLDGVVPLLLVCAAGFLFMAFCVFILGPLMLPNYSYHIALFEYGKSTGSTPIGMLLMKIADPNVPAELHRSIGYKMMIYEPATGVWLTCVILILTNLGTIALFLTSTIMVVCTVAFFFLSMYPKMHASKTKVG
eukprot:TRINITY_DN80629_c0_g1_i1.p1 TRINITY_DN80629_c0_g1~~TRINITY_DN80629_c0_g1_i1.p1  ORF type:complete len:767 (-),score=126.92 TRINITY_DN80629_c0_g1_i1:404-2704(-)